MWGWHEGKADVLEYLLLATRINFYCQATKKSLVYFSSTSQFDAYWGKPHSHSKTQSFYIIGRHHLLGICLSLCSTRAGKRWEKEGVENFVGRFL